MSYEKDNLRNLIDIIHNPRNYNIFLPNKSCSVNSEDGERGLVLFDLRNENQKKVYEALVCYVEGKKKIR